ncbi:FAD-dependent oxidoreductase [Leucobacter triazinivorans]|uniref:FAD-dependent oxidoreductase n=1 Tax=Leucobacter triazinivorans TaxID=1784719 RepID=UPI001F0CF2D9|nr:FAD-dependent oxidoreductase [Leucobacter triazinivorans]
MIEHFDRIVIGGGAMGLATTWQLASRGLRVLLLERFSPGHDRGASHGATRNMNNAYAEDHYLDLYDEALRLWRELEAESGRQLLTLNGLVTHGDPARVRAAHDSLAARGAAIELITPDEAAMRWPGMRFEGDVLVNRDAGRIHAADALEVLDALSRERGAELRYGHRVLAIDPGPDRVTATVETPAGDVAACTAEGVVVTAGAWTSQLLDGLVDLPPLRVTEEHPAHFAVRPEFASAAWPSFNHFQPEVRRTGYRGNLYGMLTPGEGIKVGFHATGDEVDPDRRSFRASDVARAQLREHVAHWFPGLDPDSAAEISCTYTLTPSERFVLDTRGRITVGAGFSGQGFKFVPAIGRVLADATLGAARPPEAFRLDAHGVRGVHGVHDVHGVR